MNLHSVRYSLPNIDLIARYCAHLYQMTFQPTRDRRAVQYQVAAGASWNTMTERDTLSYTSAALDWQRREEESYA